ncbi:MAG: MMPL family transporter [Spirochaetota bacterium]|nr:MMPL family transporter [Spirochaetota bacterium]
MIVKDMITKFSIDHPKVIVWLMAIITLFFILITTLPAIWPNTFFFLSSLKIDTDPENMLPEDEAVRVFHHKMKIEMSLNDIVVLGVVNETHPDGVFNPHSLTKIFELTEYAKTLRWQDEDNPDKKIGVVLEDIISPSTVDNIQQVGVGTVRFEWLMSSPPKTQDEALAIRDKARRISFLNGTLISEDGKAICIYLPITSKDLSNRIYIRLKEEISKYRGDEKYFITGLPVAEDTFGVEMFQQMAISAPLAMVVIFILMFIFFRKLGFIISPMIVAMVSAICTMGLLISTGNTIHIMSSMIPIFIVPIAVLDAVHILSEFFDRYNDSEDRRDIVVHVMDELFKPMLYTSLTTSIGFASLSLTPIPPVQIFGIFVAMGVIIAWFLTITFVPSYLILLSNKSLERFGSARRDYSDQRSPLSFILKLTSKLSFNNAKLVLVLAFIMVLVAIYGISRININDNPIKWFAPSHPIREADKVLNSHFGGTYMAYLALEAKDHEIPLSSYQETFYSNLAKREKELQDWVPGVLKVFEDIRKKIPEIQVNISSKSNLLSKLETYASSKRDKAENSELEAWDEFFVFLEDERRGVEIFKEPEALKFIDKLQKYLIKTEVVGKSNSLVDIVKTVYRELVSGKEKDFRIPDSSKGVAQCLITYQGSHRPQDLFHFVTPDYKKTIIWTQLKSGDNRDMNRVIDSVNQFFAENDIPFSIEHKWFGLTYINVIWQKEMVYGMLQAFWGSFLFVFLIMTILFRSALWGIVCMLPLTVTIGLIYGIIGLLGKDYDMPVAILSSLSLGLAVDYSIHFLSRSRSFYEKLLSWDKTIEPLFNEPARAISRNVIVIGMGFLPLLFANLVPYQTVGTFIAAILLFAGIITLFILPSIIKVLENFMFPNTQACSFFCNCSTCIISGVAVVFLLIINIRQFLDVGWSTLSWISAIVILIFAINCFVLGRRDKCKTDTFYERRGGELQQ